MLLASGEVGGPWPEKQHGWHLWNRLGALMVEMMEMMVEVMKEQMR